MISCRRAASWLSHDLDVSLAFPKRAVLFLHLATCGKCVRYRRQLKLIDRWAGQWLQSQTAGSADARLSDDRAEEIARRCREAGG